MTLIHEVVGFNLAMVIWAPQIKRLDDSASGRDQANLLLLKSDLHMEKLHRADICMRPLHCQLSCVGARIVQKSKQCSQNPQIGPSLLRGGFHEYAGVSQIT